MKILIITTVPFKLNGISSVIMNYYDNMVKSDMLIDIVVPNDISEDFYNKFISNNTVVYHFSRNKNPIGYMKNLYKLLSQKKYDAVHIHGNSSTMTAELLPAFFAKTSVRIVHAHSTSCDHKFINIIFKPIFYSLYTHAVSCGEKAGDWLFKNHKYTVFKNGISVERFKPNNEIRKMYREKIGAGNRLVLGHIAAFIDVKNQEFSLKIFKHLLGENQDVLLLFLGDGENFDNIQNMAKQMGIENKIVFAGRVPDVNNYLQAIDVMLLPSLYEGFPVVLVEAQAAGVPCMVSDNVSKEVDITNTIKFFPIQKTDVWVDEIKKIDKSDLNLRAVQSAENIEKLTLSGFDIKKEAETLKLYYREAIKDCEK